MHKEWTSCRVCQSSPLTPILSLGNQYVVDFLVKMEDICSCQKVPLELVMCPRCSLVQLKHSVDPTSLFTHFWYRSGINEQMRAALQEVVDKAKWIVGLTASEDYQVLDIGANDGTLLGLYPKNFRIYKVAVEPAGNIPVENAQLVVRDFFKRGLPQLQGHKFQIITAIAMFYDVDDPAEFLVAAKELLADTGVLVIQMNYLARMLGQCAFDNISHEHVCYYSLTTLKFITDRVGLHIVDVSINDVNGGSFRIYLTKGSKPAGLTVEESNAGQKRVEAMLKAEQQAGLSSVITYRLFERRVNEVLSKLTFLDTILADEDEAVYLYGASTRGSTLMQLMCERQPGFEMYIKGAAERDPKKYGRLMVGTGIRIFPENYCRADATYFLVLPWHFKESILQRERCWGNLSVNGKLVFPLPVPTLCEWKNDKWEETVL